MTSLLKNVPVNWDYNQWGVIHSGWNPRSSVSELDVVCVVGGSVLVSVDLNVHQKEASIPCESQAIHSCE